MRGIWSRLVVIVGITAILLLGRQPAATGGEKEEIQSYRLIVRSLMDTTNAGTKSKIRTDTDIDYTLRRRGREVTIIFDSARLAKATDGNEIMNMTMSRTGMTRIVNSRKEEMRYEDAPEELKEMLKACFRVPLCKVTLGPDGRETKRVVTAGPAAKLLLDQGLLEITRLFHGPFPAKQDKWTAPAEISFGNGYYARGELTYEKVGRQSGGQTRVRVSGTLMSKDIQIPGGAVAKARVEVKGEQTFRTDCQCWSSGNLDLSVAVEIEADGVPVRSATGTMRLRLTRRRAD